VTGLDATAAEAIIEAMGLLAAAVVALQISQTIAEEEVVRNAQVSAPTRVRRFLSRFMVAIVVAVAVEALVATFKAREKPELLLNAAAILGSVGVLLAAWGLFIRFNRYAEELEPEAMAEAKRGRRQAQIAYRHDGLKMHGCRRANQQAEPGQPEHPPFQPFLAGQQGHRRQGNRDLQRRRGLSPPMVLVHLVFGLPVPFG
jgi:hypothetical protein